MNTKVMVIGDLHGNANRLWKMMSIANEQGIRQLIQLGDFGFLWGADTDHWLQRINASLEFYSQKLWFIDGNHENFDLLYQYEIDPETGRRPIRPNIDHLPRGYRWQMGDKTWMALGGAVSIDKADRQMGVDWWPQEELTYSEVLKATKDGPVDVLLTHDCPEGITVPGTTESASFWPAAGLEDSLMHQRLIRGAVDQLKPKVLFHGHFHTMYQDVLKGDGYQTMVYGIGCDQDYIKENYQIVIVEQDE